MFLNLMKIPFLLVTLSVRVIRVKLILGCQAVLRYLEKVAEKKKKIGGALFVAGWFGVDKV